MEELNAILNASIASSGDTVDKLLGAAFVVVSKDGIYPPLLDKCASVVRTS